jgi:hypothetical protein
MPTPYIDQIVKEILTDMSHGKKSATAPADSSSVPDFEDTFGKIIQDDDETSRDVMRRIWNELKHTYR